ncbi:hypothetical protein TWF694_006034 [Orbilia ellipsospora]|uniref:Uncharacterized protein n=1 Tax=Orbilia ellipsospora TaxID=2528407 RepID=A0AAV9WR20_9PEZI
MALKSILSCLAFLSLAAGVRASPAPIPVATSSLDCLANNCLRAIRATNSPTRQADCTKYLLATVTPTTITFTHTNTYSTTATVTETQTSISTIDATSTETDLETFTVTVTSTATTSVTDVSTSVVDVTVTSTYSTTRTIISNVPTTVTSHVPAGNTVFKAKAKRIATPTTPITVTPSIIPTYASPCSGFTAYVSACACVGYLPSTTTVAAPSTTITVSTTISQTTTLSPTVTVSTTVTDQSATISITDGTVTVTSIPTYTSHIITVTTTTQTVATISTTETSTTTTVVPLPIATIIAPFYLQAQGSSLSGQWLTPCNGIFACFTTNQAAAAIWQIDQNGYLFDTAGGYASAQRNDVSKGDYVFLTSLDVAMATNILVCSVGGNSVLHCVGQGTGYSFNGAMPAGGNGVLWNIANADGVTFGGGFGVILTALNI